MCLELHRYIYPQPWGHVWPNKLLSMFSMSKQTYVICRWPLYWINELLSILRMWNIYIYAYTYIYIVYIVSFIGVLSYAWNVEQYFFHINVLKFIKDFHVSYNFPINIYSLSCAHIRPNELLSMLSMSKETYTRVYFTNMLVSFDNYV